MKNTRGSDKRCGSKPGLPFYLGGRFGATSCKLSSPKEKDSIPPSQEKADAIPTTISAKADIIPAYFKAMLACYCSDGKVSPQVSIETFGAGDGKFYIYTDPEGKFIVRDGFTDNFGCTIVEWKVGGKIRPVWMMSYTGEYGPDAIPILKQALRASFEAKEWRGGRGPAFLEVGNYQYHNDVASNNPLGFKGSEWISRLRTEPSEVRCVGQHNYIGHALLKFVTP